MCPVHGMQPLFHFSVYFYSSRNNPHEPPFHLHSALRRAWYILLIGHVFDSNGRANVLSAHLRDLILLYLTTWITTSHSICYPWPIYKTWCWWSFIHSKSIFRQFWHDLPMQAGVIGLYAIWSISLWQFDGKFASGHACLIPSQRSSMFAHCHKQETSGILLTCIYSFLDFM